MIATNGITLHVAQAGPREGPLVILLHGFPEAWFCWEGVMLPLAEQGYRVWAPDQRGYNLSEKPEGLDAYTLDQLAADIVGLIDAAGRADAYVVGHDWGAAVAWWLALKHSARVCRLGILNVPHPAAMTRRLQSDPRQMLKSWYMFFFQIPSLPEFLISRGNWRAGVRSLVGSSRPGTFSPEELDRYRAAWSQPGAMRSMLNWYRALFRRPFRISTGPRIHVPTLILWGVQDRFLEVGMAQASADLCDDAHLVLFPDATHWLQREEPQRVSELLADFFSSPTDEPR